jgi:hypothetical protein
VLIFSPCSTLTQAALSPEDLVRVCHRLGCIGSDTEENHVAEARWQQGLELLFPGLVQRIAAAAGDEHAPEPPPEVNTCQLLMWT